MNIHDWLAEQARDSYGNNLLLNGDFENGALADYVAVNSSVIVGGVDSLGNYIAKIGATTGNLDQVIPATNVPFQPDLLHFYAFCWVRAAASRNNFNAHIKLTIMYEDYQQTIAFLPLSNAWDTEFTGTAHDGSILYLNYYLAETYVPVRPIKDSPVYAIIATIENDASSVIYVDNFMVTLNHNALVVKNTYNERTTQDKNGINPHALDFYKNMVWNSGFERFDASTLEPLNWTGGVSTPDSNFSGSYSLKLEFSETAIQSGSGIINPTWYGGGKTRVSFRARK